VIEGFETTPILTIDRGENTISLDRRTRDRLGVPPFLMTWACLPTLPREDVAERVLTVRLLEAMATLSETRDVPLRSLGGSALGTIPRLFPIAAVFSYAANVFSPNDDLAVERVALVYRCAQRCGVHRRGSRCPMAEDADEIVEILGNVFLGG
jgi:hypothetical protein